MLGRDAVLFILLFLFFLSAYAYSWLSFNLCSFALHNSIITLGSGYDVEVNLIIFFGMYTEILLVKLSKYNGLVSVQRLVLEL